MTNYFIHFFHSLIIAGFILSFNGCGYKGDPIYVSEKTTQNQNSAKVSE
ncbi:hypothetical protein [Poseidonibacter sp.]